MSLNETEMDFLLSTVANSVWQHQSLTPCHWDTGRTCRWSITWGGTLPLWPASRSHCWTVVKESVCRIWHSSSKTWRRKNADSYLAHLWDLVFLEAIFFWQMRNGLGQKWFSFSKMFLGSSVWSAAKPPWAELNVWWLMEKQFKSHHELLVMKGLRVNVLLGTGYTLGRLGGRRDEPPSVSWILSLPAAK